MAGALVTAAALVAAVMPAASARTTAAPEHGGHATAAHHGTAPYLDPRLPVRQRVADLLGRMTLEEKVGQMTQAERGAVDSDQGQITDLKLGSLLSGGGSTPASNTPRAWADMIDGYQSHALATRLHIPLLYGIDAVHGDNNLVGATIFPHNIALGATRDPALVRAEEHITATETRATGPQWVFAPCLCVTRDDRWGRAYESFGEDPALVERMETAIDGFQGTRPQDLSRPDHVLATAKHFAGDGDTAYGTSTTNTYTIDQGVTVTDHRHFAAVDLAPYVPAVREHHVGSVMPSYSSVRWTDVPGSTPVKMSASKELLTGVLKEKIGFQGFLISDWEAIHQLPGDYATQVRTAVDAGLDMFMEPYSAERFEQTLVSEVRAGRVPMARIDDAVSRILRAKFELGLFEHPYTDRRDIGTIGSPEHRAVARRAVAESQVLLKNDHGALPLKPSQRIYVAEVNADDLGNQAGGWTVTWQGQSGNGRFPGTTILQGIRQAAPDVTYSADASAPTAGYDVGVVVVGETPYAEGMGDVGNGHTLDLSAADRAAVDKVCGAIRTCVVLDVAGRPQIVTDELPKADAFVMSWLPGSEGEGVADVLFGKRPFTGKLPVSWPRAESQEPVNVGDHRYDPLFRYGYGLTTGR
ncbi:MULTISPECIES: glycoside hydrolase family 3 protein [Streptomycetaceae]|uniref:beta-glucosidase n=1 Tax=Streptantibioticus cattleyicolor (strain ATCC 35852 / DSM 46488 / JCM 4925 / NBRC 14057 / NRRL 8057) TaxID=1003195 RepID=G8WYT4_STREN|nr:glycoside hydrolase family 3 protein [Streptantibioticus cattleyicolor]AEW92475.1 glycoside hydrolase family 3 domain protein [Streptantibioticus cattleyicolor NRRL 8057 = DSM 46488]